MQKFTEACGLDYYDNELAECTSYGTKIDEVTKNYLPTILHQ